MSKGMAPAELERLVESAGGRDVRVEKLLKLVFCELSEDQAKRLSQDGRLKVKPAQEMRSAGVAAPPARVPVPFPGADMLASDFNQLQSSDEDIQNTWDIFAGLRALFEPPITGQGLTVAVLDSGVRKTHQSLVNRVVYEKNFTDSPGTTDVFNHGTQVAFAVAGMDSEGRAGVAPGANVMNIKVLSDEGLGTDETVVDGIEEVIELVEQARMNGLHPTDPMFPNVINLSLGSEDDGDPDNPVRVACREAVNTYGLDVVAAVGNEGPKMSTIMLPAVDELVIAVGGLESNWFTVWEKSARGPTLEGVTKPDFCLWATDLEMASGKADDEYVTKSGTSFSCPMVCGLYGLLWEVSRIQYGPDALFSWVAAREFAPYYCTKPADAVIKKDNTYGYGLPAMSSMVSQMAQAVSPLEQTVEMFQPVMMLGMMGVLVRGAF
ncbi:S8 family serine peptidase [Chloroflexota bacterium]